MNQTLADRFEACRKALSAGRHAEAHALLLDIDSGNLAPASLALHTKLMTLAAAAPGTTAGDAGPEQTDVLLSTLDQAPPLPGISLVSACMNRQANLLKVLPSWLRSDANEIIIVDWSSTEPLAPMLAHIDDARLRVVRVDGEPRWILTHAFNVGLRLARHAVVYKLDADIELTADGLARNRFAAGEFVRGFWKSAVDAGEPDQRYTNGSFGAFKADLRAVGYYNERILTYGWDDSDLYARLSNSLGRAGRLLQHGSLRHLPQEEDQRLKHQAVDRTLALGRFAPTEFENLTNKFHELTSLEWSYYSQAQDYTLESTGGRVWHAHRTTAVPTHRIEERDLALVLAMRQLATWAGDLLPASAWSTACSLEFARLLQQAHATGHSQSLATALRERRGLHCISVAAGPLRQATEKTLTILCQQRSELDGVLLILEDDGFHPGAARSGAPQLLRASPDLVQVLVQVLSADPYSDLTRLEAVLTAGSDRACTHWTIDVAGLAQSAINHARTIGENLQGRVRLPTQPASRTAFVTSVYDETNLLRLLEYLACVALNLQAVEHMVLLYEARTGLFQLVVQTMCRSLGVAPGRLALTPFDRRPTFAELFAVQSLLPDGTLLVVGNADVALDATLADLAAAARDDHVYVLSRWDIDDQGTSAHLIRLESGIPNVFSADAWIARTPFRPDFLLDYEIGSFHCDSFINNQLSRSSRYRWANPCLDVHVFHLHDSRFNSSAEKHVRDRIDIERRYGAERERNGGEDPLKGAPWSHLADAHRVDDPAFLIHWRSKFMVLDMTAPGFDLASLIWLHLLHALVCSQDDHAAIVVRLRSEDSAGPAGRLLAQYKAHHHLPGMLVEIDDHGFDAATAPFPTVLVRQSSNEALLTSLQAGGAVGLVKEVKRLMAWAPDGSGVAQTRCSLATTMGTAATQVLIQAMRDRLPEAFASLVDFTLQLDRWDAAGLLLRPFAADLAAATPAAVPLVGLAPPAVSFVTSLFRGNEFLPGYLDNVAQAALAADGEVILVDANCDDHDTAGIEAYFAGHPELRDRFTIVRLDRDPGLYACWRLAIERARGEFVTNANLDDRRSPLHTRLLVQALRDRPHLAGAAGSISAVTRHAPGSWFEMLPNQIWFQDLGAREFGHADLFARLDDGTVRSHNIMHCMPVWRRSLHSRYGFFDEERYGTSADWAFWLACARQGERFWLQPEAMGRYFVNPNSHNRRNDSDGAKERRILHDLLGVEQSHVQKQ